jgi:YHS domain-containing protein
MRSFSRFTALTRHVVAATLLLAVTAVAAAAQAGHGPQNIDDNGVILKGFDAVAFHTQNAPVQGSPSLTATHDGAIYHFASAANRDAFKANPARYAPAYGGYCAMGVSIGKKLDGDPAAFSVVDGKLYLNVNPEVRSMWARDIPGNERKAQRNWMQVAAARGFDRM